MADILIFRFRRFQEKSAYQEVLLVVVPDASGIGSVSGHTGGDKKRRNWLVEEEVVSDQLLLGRVRHFVKREVLAYSSYFMIFSRIKFTLKVAIKSIESAKRDALDLSSLSSGAPGRERISSDRSAGSDSDGENVVGIERFVHDEPVGEVGLVHIGGLVSAVACFNDLVEEFGKGLVRDLVASNAANGHDEGMAGVVDAGLDDVIDREAGLGLSRAHSLV